PSQTGRAPPPLAERDAPRCSLDPRLPDASAFDGGPHQVPPLGPGTVIVPYLGEAQQVGEDEPGVGAPLADAAVGDHVVLRLQPFPLHVDRPQLLRALEGAVLPDRLGPAHIPSPGDVAAPPGPLLGVLGHAQLLAIALV